MKAVCCFDMSRATNPVTQLDITGDLNALLQGPKISHSCLLFVIVSISKQMNFSLPLHISLQTHT
jgi:hypothetical protein